VQLTIDILLIMVNSIFGHMFMIELSLLIVVCVSINNPNKKSIIVSFINKVVLTIYVATLSFYCFIIFKYIY
jgi:hypothetical protein